LFRQLVDAQDGDDVLEVLVALEDLLHAASHAVVVVADVLGRDDAAAGGERVHGGGDPLLGGAALQVHRAVGVGEGGGGGRVGVVVGGHVDGLDGGHGAVAGGGDALLELAHLGAEGRLVAHGGGHAAEEGRHLGARLREAEDVVDEQQGVDA